NGDVVLLRRVVEVGDDAWAVRRLQERKGVVASPARHCMAAGIADQDVVAGATLQRFGTVGGDQDRVAACGGRPRRRRYRVVNGYSRRVAGRDSVRRLVCERAAGRRVIDEESVAGT